MSVLDVLFISSAVSVLIVLLLSRTTSIDKLAPALYAVLFIILINMSSLGYGGDTITSAFNPEFLGFTLHWRYDAVSWFFAIITVGIGLLVAIYMAGDWAKYYREKNPGGAYGTLQIALVLNVFTMLVLLGSGDLLSLFIGWELVSWASFLMMALNPAKAARQAAVKYIIYAMAGAMAFMAAMAIIYSATGSLDYAQITQLISTLSKTQITVLVVLFAAGFGIKMGLVPFHLWQAVAYAETPGPGAVFLGAISARMGLYAIIVVLIQLIGLAYLSEIKIPYTFLNLQTTLAWIAALTTIIPTYIALQQNDARHLLAWHGVGQGGYMLLGLMVADSIGSAGGLMHVFNYASYQAVLFMTVTAVVYRTGTSDFNKLGGLVTQMPLSFMVMVIGIIGLAGIPPMNGFVSKWLVYRSLLLDGQPLLFVAAVIATLGTILSVYKLVHNTFLGQIRKEHLEIREAPWSMMVPMLILSAIIFITGMMPGIVLDWVASVQAAVGLPVIPHTLGGIVLKQGGLDMIWITLILFYGFGVGAILFYFTRGKAKRVHQYDNYAGGHFLTSEVRYHYSNHFYAGLMNLIGGWYRGTFVWLERALVSVVSFISQLTENMYRSNQPIMLAVIVIVVTLWIFIYGSTGTGADELIISQGGVVK
jgi:NADH-quinone oxidoreductase subunit M